MVNWSPRMLYRPLSSPPVHESDVRGVNAILFYLFVLRVCLQRVMLLLDARHGFKKADIEFLGLLYDPKGPSPLGKTPFQCPGHDLER